MNIPNILNQYKKKFNDVRKKEINNEVRFIEILENISNKLFMQISKKFQSYINIK